jgi:hypothetical protein
VSHVATLGLHAGPGGTRLKPPNLLKQVFRRIQRSSI